MEIKAPAFPESVVEGTVVTWHIQPGEQIQQDAPLADIETDKVVLEVVAPANGTLEKVLKNEGDTVAGGEVIAIFAKGDGEAQPAKTEAAEQPAGDEKQSAAEPEKQDSKAGPAARKMLKEQGIDPAEVTPSGKGGRITKADLTQAQSAPTQTTAQSENTASDGGFERLERRVPMTRLRASIAKRLVQAQQDAAMLTTFNEVNMQPLMDLRTKYRDAFEKANNGVRLGFMGFFVRAASEALKRFPAVNASIDGNDIVYHGYQDIGVAVSSERGLVVPVVRHTEHKSIADIESQIRDFAGRAQTGKIQIDELQGGTFTITNGGVFGSLVSTPILNPPQTAILGMHATKERPVAENGQVVIRPMMYLALSYDHRVIDGKEAVQFLVAIKDMIEDPARIILEL